MDANTPSSEKKEKKAANNEKLITRRRKFIREHIYAEGKITEEAVRNFLAREEKKQKFSAKVLKRDIDFINTYENRTIFRQQNPNTKIWEWVDDSRKLGSTREERRLYNEKEKKQIAQLASCFILGFEKFEASQGAGKTPIFIDHLAQVKQVLNFSKIADSRSELQRKLEDFWADGERRIFLDSGTTTETVAEKFLQFFRLPMNGMISKHDGALVSNEQPVNKIEVITNDRHIFFCLGEPDVHIKTIVVGGRQQFKTTAISGMMAERFLESNDIIAGMAIVGTTAICLNKNSKTNHNSFFYAENEHVASIKRSFLRRAKIRIIIADSSKFHSQGEHADTRICSLNKGEIDLVITNKIYDQTAKDALETRRIFDKHEVPLIDFEAIATT